VISSYVLSSFFPFLRLSSEHEANIRGRGKTVHVVFRHMFISQVGYRKRRAERPERGGPCCLLKLKQMGTLGVHMKGILPWLVGSVGLVVSVQ
jgi:hypothetical protein